MGGSFVSYLSSANQVHWISSNLREPLYPRPDHQCKVINKQKYACLNVGLQGDLEEKGWERREEIAEMTYEWHLGRTERDVADMRRKRAIDRGDEEDEEDESDES